MAWCEWPNRESGLPQWQEQWRREISEARDFFWAAGPLLQGNVRTWVCGWAKRNGKNARQSRRPLQALGHWGLQCGSMEGLGAAVDEPEKLGVEEEDGGGDNPGDDLGYAGICEFAHPGAIAGELNQGNDGEGQLKT